jgi:hypothetical protein
LQEFQVAEYREDCDPNREARDKCGPVRTIGMLVVAFTIILGGLFAYGLPSKGEKQASASHKFDVRIVGGPLPGIVVESKNVLAGTMRIPVDVPARGAMSETGAAEKSIQP